MIATLEGFIRAHRDDHRSLAHDPALARQLVEHRPAGSPLPAVPDESALPVITTVLSRVRRSWFKRINPVRLAHPLVDRFARVERLDRHFRPDVVLLSAG